MASKYGSRSRRASILRKSGDSPWVRSGWVFKMSLAVRLNECCAEDRRSRVKARAGNAANSSILTSRRWRPAIVTAPLVAASRPLSQICFLLNGISLYPGVSSDVYLKCFDDLGIHLCCERVSLWESTEIIRHIDD